jgi:hypothetical protein
MKNGECKKDKRKSDPPTLAKRRAVTGGIAEFSL